MAKLLTELLHDATQRADDIVNSLDMLTTGGLKVNAYRLKMKNLATQARDFITRLLRDPDIEDPNYAGNYFRDYSHVTRLLREIEYFSLLVLKRFNDSDQRATDLVSAICAESGYPYEAPLCSAISSQYFWTIPDMDLVFMPCLEPDHVLSLPDIYHELGHFLLFRDEKRFIQPAQLIVDRHYEKMVENGKRQNWATASLELVEQYHHSWKGSWLLEFASDLIATYLIGPSFGWCNIRVATNLGGELFLGTDSHPADDARATAIGMMLTELGFDESRQKIQKRWSELVSLAMESTPPRYDLAYPECLLRELTQFFQKECENIGLSRFEKDASDKPVAKMIHDCWTQFRNDPENYVKFERNQLEEIAGSLRM
ncbi:hypothetical protein V6x_54640 [Gimesia chilikensis]|uniref:Uncharacterized protein n=1 Tax=Gimesia chilikensis TaxID=2605989 RepID=A0A517WKE1_9PLAN|nr:hypothetical protein [Gimesia chilikensis]QDU05723.1 hypothetical protein V6x_54640 [Gimesia chilikensis]